MPILYYRKNRTKIKPDLKNLYHHELMKLSQKSLASILQQITGGKMNLAKMKRYYEIKSRNRKISDEDIAKMLKIKSVTLIKWKKQFKRQQFHSNTV